MVNIRCCARVLILGGSLGLAACGEEASPTSPSRRPSPFAAESRIIAIEGSLAFGDVPLNQTKELAITIHNQGSGVLTLGDVTGLESLAPLISIGGASRTIQPGASTTMMVRFTPRAAGPVAGTLTIAADHTAGNNRVILTGLGAGPRITVAGIVTDYDTRQPIAQARVEAWVDGGVVQFAPLATATADANGYYEVILPSAVPFRLIYVVSNYSGRIDYASFGANTRRDVTLVPSWPRLGSGNAAFDVPKMPSRVRLDASSDEPVADFAMRVGGVMVVSQTLRKTSSLTATYSNVHQINGGWVEISASPGVRWSFRRVE